MCKDQYTACLRICTRVCTVCMCTDGVLKKFQRAPEGVPERSRGGPGEVPERSRGGLGEVPGRSRGGEGFFISNNLSSSPPHHHHPKHPFPLIYPTALHCCWLWALWLLLKIFCWTISCKCVTKFNSIILERLFWRIWVCAVGCFL